MTPLVALGSVLDEARPGFACGAVDPQGVVQVRMNNIANGTLVFNTVRRVPPKVADLSRFGVSVGDVLFNATNSPELVGKSALFRGYPEPVVYSNHFLRLRPTPGALDGAYLSRWLHMLWMRGVFSHLCRQWVNQATVASDRLLSLELPLPPLLEQRRIAAILDKADDLRANRGTSLAALDGLAQSVFVEMFGDPVENPFKHPVRHLIDLVDARRPITYGILKPGPDQSDGVTYIRVVDMKDGGVDPTSIRRTTRTISDSYRRSLLKPDDVLLSIRGHVGRVATVPPALEGANITQDTARLAISGVSSVFLRECLRTVALQRWMAQRTKGVAVTGINLTDVKLIPVIVPPESQQSAFADRIEVVDRLRLDQRLSRNALDRLFASIQCRAFAGEL